MEPIQNDFRSSSNSPPSFSGGMSRTSATQRLKERLVSYRLELTELGKTSSPDNMALIVVELLRDYKGLILDDVNKGIQPQHEVSMWIDCFQRPLKVLSSGFNRRSIEDYIEFGVAFYEGFIEDLCIRYDLVPMSPSARAASGSSSQHRRALDQTVKSAASWVLQKVLIRVGDLLNHGHHYHPAIVIYQKAGFVNPTNGVPFYRMGYTQIMINGHSLEGQLVAIAYFARALSVAEPCLAARQNLEEALKGVDRLHPMSALDEFILSFLVRIRSLMKNVYMVAPSAEWMTRYLTPLVAKSAINGNHLLRVIIIGMWLWRRETSNLVVNVRVETDCLDVLVRVLNAILIAASSYGDITNYYAIPHIKLVLEWLRCSSSLLNSSALNMLRTALDTHKLCLYLNRIRDVMGQSCMFQPYMFEKTSLPEEKQLLGFLPMKHTYEKLPMVMEETDPQVMKLRVYRTLLCAKGICDSSLGIIELNMTGQFCPVPLPKRPVPSSLSFSPYMSETDSSPESRAFNPFMSPLPPAYTAPSFEPNLPSNSRSSNTATSMHGVYDDHHHKSSRSDQPMAPIGRNGNMSALTSPMDPHHVFSFDPISPSGPRTSSPTFVSDGSSMGDSLFPPRSGSDILGSSGQFLPGSSERRYSGPFSSSSSERRESGAFSTTSSERRNSGAFSTPSERRSSSNNFFTFNSIWSPEQFDSADQLKDL